MSTLKAVELLLLEDLLEMGSGYVLNFTDRTFGEFFVREIGVDIDDAKFRQNGTSKAKRLRSFVQTAEDFEVACALSALWEYREALRERNEQEEKFPSARARLFDLIRRLEGGSPPQASSSVAIKLAPTVTQQLRADFIGLSALEPQPRGYAFEKYLKTLFDAFGLEAREPFRLRGEQIDGSFQLGNETYLLEAKWQNALSAAADLHAFHGKLENKAAWSRGLFISQNGFTEDGLHAFGSGKRLICMDGLDLCDLLERNLHLADILNLKVRRAAETGRPFTRVRDLVV